MDKIKRDQVEVLSIYLTLIKGVPHRIPFFLAIFVFSNFRNNFLCHKLIKRKCLLKKSKEKYFYVKMMNYVFLLLA